MKVEALKSLKKSESLFQTHFIIILIYYIINNKNLKI